MVGAFSVLGHLCIFFHPFVLESPASLEGRLGSIGRREGEGIIHGLPACWDNIRTMNI